MKKQLEGDEIYLECGSKAEASVWCALTAEVCLVGSVLSTMPQED